VKWRKTLGDEVSGGQRKGKGTKGNGRRMGEWREMQDTRGREKASWKVGPEEGQEEQKKREEAREEKKILIRIGRY
jgi:hypothetical protein